MPSERTPLVQTVVVTHRSARHPHSTFRRFCTIALGCSLIILTICFLIPITILPHDHHHRPSHDTPAPSVPSPWPKSHGLSYDGLQRILLETPDPEKARAWSKYYTSGPHLAGKNLSQAAWTKQKWEEFGIKSEIIAYDVYINYPLDHRLALLRGKKDNLTVTYECDLAEDVLEEDATTGLQDSVPTFHGYSASGNVTASFVYVNFGTYHDFQDLIKANVSLEGKIAIVKYGRNFRGMKVKHAQDLGMVGIVLYSDPQSDEGITEDNGYKPYPDGPARNPSSVQRGSTQFIQIMSGDPTTPGYPSKPGVHRENPHTAIPRIPSLPISYRDALPLLKALNGHGPRALDFNEYWQDGGLSYKGVQYNIGPSPDDVVLNLFNLQEYVITPLWDVIGIINGTLSDEVVILGNHRDAWIAGGAADPNSGSAALNEVIRAFGTALRSGWKPLRTMVFASWDGEEYGLVGSTEWVEEYFPWLSSSAVAYLNVDVGTRGSRFHASAAPNLHSALYETASLVPSPKGGLVLDHWDGRIGVMGSGSDFTPFQDFAGVSSLDMEYLTDDGDAVNHYHSNYDSFYWMDNYGDQTWEYHVSMAQIWALLAAKIVETPIIPMNATNYAVALQTYIAKIKSKAKNSTLSTSLDFRQLDEASSRFTSAADAFDRYAIELSDSLEVEIPWWKWWEKLRLFREVTKVNRKYKLLDRQFLYAGGLDNRQLFKHVVYAPGRWTGYAGATLPGLIESVEDGNLTNAIRWSHIISESMDRATNSLS